MKKSRHVLCSWIYPQVGSLVPNGMLDAQDRQGQSLRKVLEAEHAAAGKGSRPAEEIAASLVLPPQSVKEYVEVHIEQGPGAAYEEGLTTCVQCATWRDGANSLLERVLRACEFGVSSMGWCCSAALASGPSYIDISGCAHFPNLIAGSSAGGLGRIPGGCFGHCWTDTAVGGGEWHTGQSACCAVPRLEMIMNGTDAAVGGGKCGTQTSPYAALFQGCE
eukprot:1158335-Pelagomonas_calceolata.AAC.8